MKVLCYDPSGNFHEGNGITGWAYFEDGKLIDFGDIKAQDFDDLEAYWAEVGRYIHEYVPDVVVCESYRLFANKAQSQSWSQLETPQLIGYLRMLCWQRSTAMVFQNPSDKKPVADPILVRMGVIERKGNRYYCKGRLTNDHMRDAIRHGVFYHRFRKGR